MGRRHCVRWVALALCVVVSAVAALGLEHEDEIIDLNKLLREKRQLSFRGQTQTPVQVQGRENLCERMGGECYAQNDQCPPKLPVRYFLRPRDDIPGSTSNYCGSDYVKTDCCAPAGMVFTVDLENSLLFALQNTVPYNASIASNTTDPIQRHFTMESRDAFMKFLKLVEQYLSYPDQIKLNTWNFIHILRTHLEAAGDFQVSELQNTLNLIQQTSNSLPLSSWQPSVGCHYIRSTHCYYNNWLYTCGMWQIFHTITVSASRADTYTNYPLEVIQAIYGYVEHFTDCPVCLGHFIQIYDQTIGVVPDKVDTADHAILWLWCAHGMVNQVSDKSINPVPYFPLKTVCPQCYHDCPYITTDCSQLFCPDDSSDCWATTESKGKPVNYYSFCEKKMVDYLKQVYGGTYNKLNTYRGGSDKNLFQVNDKCPTKKTELK